MSGVYRVGTGAGFSADRLDPAVDLARHGALDAMIIECVGERTLAFGHRDRMLDPTRGYNAQLENRMRALLPPCRQAGTVIITNMGAANPRAAAERTVAVARELGLAGLKVACIEGDEVSDVIAPDTPLMDELGTLADAELPVVGMNAYLGVDAILPALQQGADVVMGGRLADPSLSLAPLVHRFGWTLDDWQRLGAGTLVGHLLECGMQITGGYFADPGIKDMPDLARLGFPIGEVREDGELVVTKVEGSGGSVTPATVKEQLLYEIHDPTKYFQPDVIADFSDVRVEEIGPDRVRVTGGRGAAKTGLLKTSVGYVDSFVGEGQISYAGPGAVARGKLALDIVRERLALTGVTMSESRFDLIGVNALHGDTRSHGAEPYEVRVRVVGRTDSLAEATRIGNEVETLYTNGPAGGGGAWKSAREIVAVASALVPESAAQAKLTILEV
jgi:hypothetical protein